MADTIDAEIGIAELAARAGVTPRTVRYYVAEGLLPPPGGAGQRRSYSPEHLRRLELIRQFKAAYLPLHEIRRRLNAPASGHASEIGAETTPELPGGVGHGSPIADTRGATGMVAATSAVSPAVGAIAEDRPPLGFRNRPGVGRIEIFDPPETVWRRFALAPGVELHYRETDDPKLAEAIQRLIREATAILDASPSGARGRQPRDGSTEGGT